MTAASPHPDSRAAEIVLTLSANDNHRRPRSYLLLVHDAAYAYDLTGQRLKTSPSGANRSQARVE